MKSEPVKRGYDTTRRRAQAQQLRLDVANAARAVFIDRGYAATTIADVAQAAGVSTQFVHKAFGTKAGLLVKVIDWTLAGDDAPVPMAQRPSILAVQQERTVAGKCARYAHHGRLVASRIAETLRMLRGAADADPEARAIYENGEHQRRTGARLFAANLASAGPLRAGMTTDDAGDAIWALVPDVLWTTLVVHAGWTPDHFEQHYAGLIAASVLDDKHLPAVRRRSHTLVTTATAET